MITLITLQVVAFLLWHLWSAFEDENALGTITLALVTIALGITCVWKVNS